MGGLGFLPSPPFAYRSSPDLRQDDLMQDG
jgi:hypothetical protein